MLNSVAVLWISVDSSVNRRRNPVVDQAEGLLFSHKMRLSVYTNGTCQDFLELDLTFLNI
jgi:hypothetical protein